jgi:hypothetical protein
MFFLDLFSVCHQGSSDLSMNDALNTLLPLIESPIMRFRKDKNMCHQNLEGVFRTKMQVGTIKYICNL